MLRSSTGSGATADAEPADNWGAEVVARLLSTDPPLKHLDLRSNGITDIGKSLISDSLESNTHLCALLMDGKTLPEIAARLARNKEYSQFEEPVRARDVALIRSVYRTTNQR